MGWKGIRLRPLILVWAISILSAGLSTTIANADQKRPILTLCVASEPGAVLRAFDLEALRALGTTTIVTETPWTDGETRFTGVLVRDLLDEVDVKAETVQAIALNDYLIEIPVDDFLDHNVILAFERDSTVLTVRNRGPLWIIYPWSDDASLKTAEYYARSIWQLTKIELQDL